MTVTSPQQHDDPLGEARGQLLQALAVLTTVGEAAARYAAAGAHNRAARTERRADAARLEADGRRRADRLADTTRTHQDSADRRLIDKAFQEQWLGKAGIRGAAELWRTAAMRAATGDTRSREAMRLAEGRLRQLHPILMDAYARHRAGGMDLTDAMRAAAHDVWQHERSTRARSHADTPYARPASKRIGTGPDPNGLAAADELDAAVAAEVRRLAADVDPELTLGHGQYVAQVAGLEVSAVGRGRHRRTRPPARRTGQPPVSTVPQWRYPVPMEQFGLTASEGPDRIAPWVDLHTHVRRLGQSDPPAAIVPLCTAAVDALHGIAVALRTPDRERALILASRFSVFGGWMMQEAGDDKSALSWTAAAVDLAASAGDTSLAAYAMVRHGLIHLNANRPAETVALAQQAQKGTSDSWVRALALLREAQGLARLGDVPGCLRALDLASELFEAADAVGESSMRVGTSNLSNPAEAARAWCLHDLDRSAQAADILENELRAMPKHAVRARTRWGARLALALASIREVERAVVVLETVLPAVAAVDSWTIRLDLRRTSAVLRRWHKDPHVRRIMPALTVVVAP
jgi:hypothetical protein